MDLPLRSLITELTVLPQTPTKYGNKSSWKDLDLENYIPTSLFLLSCMFLKLIFIGLLKWIFIYDVVDFL